MSVDKLFHAVFPGIATNQRFVEGTRVIEEKWKSKAYKVKCEEAVQAAQHLVLWSDSAVGELQNTDSERS